MQDIRPQLLFDAARTASDPDEFSFRELGKRLAGSIADLLKGEARNSSFVLGIEGRWGSGKSTILNYVREELATALRGQKYYLIDFDPWWLEEGANVSASLLMSVLGTLPKTEATKTLAAMGYLAAAAGKLPPGVGALLKLSKKTEGLGELLEGVQEAGGDLDAILNAAKPTRKLRDEVSKAFREGGHKFVVFIDDLDRLSPAQALQVMSAIRSIADLPGFVYVLAYDAAALENILAHSNPPLGADYFEKIVNISIPVPPVTTDQMRGFLAKLLGTQLAVALADKQAEAHSVALIDLLDAPRDAVRLANVVNFWIGAKTDEVFLPDFILLEAIRLAHPQAYGGLLRTADVWTGKDDENDPLRGLLREGEAQRDAEKARVATRVARELGLEESAEHSKVKAALSVLFPKAAQYLGGEFGFMFGSSASDERKIENRRHFFTYFLHRPIPGAPSKAEVDALLDPALSFEARAHMLGILIGRPEADVDPTEYLLAVLEAARGRGSISRGVDIDLIRALAANASRLDEQQEGYLQSPVDVAKGFAVRSMSHWRKLSDAEVEQIFDPALSLSMLAALHLALTAGTSSYLLDDPGNNRVVEVSAAALKRATDLLGERLITGLGNGKLFAGARVPRLLHMAFKFNAAATVEALKPTFADDQKLIEFMEHFLGYTNPISTMPAYFGISLFAIRNRVEAAMEALNRSSDAWAPWGWFKDIEEEAPGTI